MPAKDRGDMVGDGDRKRAEAFYRRLLGIFPKPRSDADNVVNFPGRAGAHQRRKTPQPALARPEQGARAVAQSRREDRANGIEGLLKRLFEDLSKDD